MNVFLRCNVNESDYLAFIGVYDQYLYPMRKTTLVGFVFGCTDRCDMVPRRRSR